MLKIIKNGIIFLRTTLIKRVYMLKTFLYLKQNKIIEVLKKVLLVIFSTKC